MDIHKPKPWHGLREFLKEYVIIVVGVLTALGAEQTVEWLHWQAKAHVGEASLKRDLTLVADFATERVAINRCQMERLAQIRDAVIASPAKWEGALPPDPTWTAAFHDDAAYHFPTRVWLSHIWENLAADGTLAHLDPERARNFAFLYRRIQRVSDSNDAETEALSEVSVLDSKGVILTPDGKLRLLAAISRMRSLEVATRGNARQILRQIRDAGYLPPLAQTETRLAADRFGQCRYAAADLKDRIANSFYTLGR